MYVWWKVSGPISKTVTKERGKLIRDTLKRNTGKLIEDGGSTWVYGYFKEGKFGFSSERFWGENQIKGVTFESFLE